MNITDIHNRCSFVKMYVNIWITNFIYAIAITVKFTVIKSYCQNHSNLIFGCKNAMYLTWKPKGKLHNLSKILRIMWASHLNKSGEFAQYWIVIFAKKLQITVFAYNYRFTYLPRSIFALGNSKFIPGIWHPFSFLSYSFSLLEIFFSKSFKAWNVKIDWKLVKYIHTVNYNMIIYYYPNSRYEVLCGLYSKQNISEMSEIVFWRG